MCCYRTCDLGYSRGCPLRLIKFSEETMYRYTLKTALISLALIFMIADTASAANEKRISFKMVVSKGASACLPKASAKVLIASHETAEDMYIVATGLPP